MLGRGQPLCCWVGTLQNCSFGILKYGALPNSWSPSDALLQKHHLNSYQISYVFTFFYCLGKFQSVLFSLEHHCPTELSAVIKIFCIHIVQYSSYPPDHLSRAIPCKPRQQPLTHIPAMWHSKVTVLSFVSILFSGIIIHASEGHC